MFAKTSRTRSAILLCAAAPLALPVFGQSHSPQEQAVWKLEDACWHCIQAVAIEGYRSLWHPDFVGWPHFSATPQTKAHVAYGPIDFKIRGVSLVSFTLKPAGSHVTGNVVITYDSLMARWVNCQGRGQPATTRVTHTWIHTSAGWQILGGISAGVPTAPSP